MPNATTPAPASPPELPPADKGGQVGVIQLLLRDQENLVRQLVDSNSSPKIRRYLVCLALGSFLVFGLVMGTFSGGGQLFFVPLKVALGIVAAALICFPSLYIFLCLSGVALSLRDAMSLLIALVAIAGLLLVGLAPVVWIFTQSTDSVAFIGMLCLICWGIALYFGTQLFAVIVRMFPGKQSKHIGAWVFIFTIVTFQMTTSLRPLLGKSPEVISTEKKFFLHHWFESSGRW